jgi:hypothetical protein
MLLQNADGKDTGVGRFFLRPAPVAGRQFVPSGREFLGSQ